MWLKKETVYYFRENMFSEKSSEHLQIVAHPQISYPNFFVVVVKNEFRLLLFSLSL